ncbi:molybdopterin-dependent oxidoreductase [Acidithiobacillus montserratensis]|uniref:Molybdopterin-dependent oxidoreductase n=1 Tax=Acidithiobacillus montserratensis TaxID=2729135 RepID=A0ACD5HGJ1_9PROT|nr:molybdopterin-dependent oxidoreductase [Acidithiobacillus montserratensis]MBN2679445.1 molybdopterin-dependent oxidoreductase [Acidithiobacillaceae bacterium]MBU2747172.1 molybdopterin-dependent oxidoreductase [Acidithiobacillus montserratensis]
MSINRRAFLRSAGGLLLAGSAGGLVYPAMAWADTKIPVFPEYYTYTGSYPEINPDAYRLQTTGLIHKPQVFTLPDLYQLGKDQEIETFHCVTGWIVNNVHWQGIALSRFLSLLEPQPSARYVAFYSADGVYVDSLTLDQARAPGVILATHISGQPLLRKGGYPLRLLVPQMYGYKSVKWVNRIVLDSTRPQGTWEKDGYANNAYIKKGFSFMDLL